MTIRIGDKQIGDGHPTYIIAEAGINHNGSLGIATKLIDAAVDAGADAIKFQKREIKEVWIDALMMGPPDAQGFGPTFAAYWDRLEFNPQEYDHITNYCKAKGIEFLCSCWDKRSVNMIDRYIKAYKIASADVTNEPLLKHIATKGKPIILSTGMSTLDMVDRAMATIAEASERTPQVILMQCTSTYPSSYTELDLNVIKTMWIRYGCPVGYSGHELGIHIPIAAVARGACIIERHITLDRTMAGADHAASLEPGAFKTMVRNIRDVEVAMGSYEKQFHLSEIPVAEHLRKSLVSTCDLKKGHELTAGDLTVKGPGTGIEPYLLRDIIGYEVKTDILKDTIINMEDIQ